MLVALLTFHEFGHAWTAWRCGDDTARLQGRVSLNPLVHIDPIGTVLLPLMMIFLPSGASRFMIGWAKPVPVNPDNLMRHNVDDILVTMAGPGMNLLLAIVLVAGARVGLMIHSFGVADYCVQAAQLSLLLCFFNLIPISEDRAQQRSHWHLEFAGESVWGAVKKFRFYKRLRQ
jgi:Zn-dependent protease